MKIRYYLRGLGLGIVFTAVFFLIGGNPKQTMSDEMIKERAKELGMIENTVLADMNDVDENEMIETDYVETVEPESVLEVETSLEEVTTQQTSSETVVDETEELIEETTVEKVQEESSTVMETQSQSSLEQEESIEEIQNVKPVDGQVISIVVNKGEGSDTVSQRLYDAGLVDDPYAYDKYLMQNGYDRRIGSGEHLIPVGSSWQEIAQFLCN